MHTLVPDGIEPALAKNTYARRAAGGWRGVARVPGAARAGTTPAALETASGMVVVLEKVFGELGD